MNFPNKVQVLPVSATVSPVTHDAEVAVNNASKKEIFWWPVWDIGSISNKEPTSIKSKNPKNIILVGVNFFLSRM